MGMHSKCERNRKLDQAEFTAMGPISRDSGVSAIAGGARKGTSSVFGWLR